MKMYVLIGGLNCSKIAISFFFTHVCIEECLLRVCNGFLQLYFKSEGLGNVSILINMFLKNKKK